MDCNIWEDPDPPYDQDPYLEVQLLVGFTILMARFIVSARKRLSEFDAFKKLLDVNDHRLVRVQPVIDVIADDVVQCDDATLKHLEERFERYVDKIFAINPLFLKAIVNPNPLVNIHRSEAIFDGSPVQALVLLIDCRKFFLDNPLALRAVKRRVGNHPVYEVHNQAIRVM